MSSFSMLFAENFKEDAHGLEILFYLRNKNPFRETERIFVDSCCNKQRIREKRVL